jgi:hypothetical protein
MIVSINWLRRYVDFDMSARELALRLTDSLTERSVLWIGAAGPRPSCAARRTCARA